MVPRCIGLYWFDILDLFLVCSLCRLPVLEEYAKGIAFRCFRLVPLVGLLLAAVQSHTRIIKIGDTILSSCT